MKLTNINDIIPNANMLLLNAKDSIIINLYVQRQYEILYYAN